MKNLAKLQLLIAAAAFGWTSWAYGAIIDLVQAPTGYFLPTDAQKYHWPYLRWNGDDWSWMHSAIGGPITDAYLLISAFDVDAAQGEVDEIWADDSGTPTLLGSFAGANDVWNFTWFTLPS